MSMKYVAALEERLRHLHRPQMFKTHSSADAQSLTLGQRMAEISAAGIGSWRFLIIQATLLAIWVLYNSLAFTKHWDSYPYILLNLALSFQAAFTGPILLIAANVGAIRDHAQADRIEKLTAQNEQLAEQNCALVERLEAMEQTFDGHVGASLQAHASELRELSALVRAVHAAVTDGPDPALDQLPAQDAPEAAPPESQIEGPPASEADETAATLAPAMPPTAQATPRPAARPARKRR